MFSRVLACTLLGLALGACGKETSPGPGEYHEPQAHERLEGSTVAAVMEIQKNELAEPCDARYFQKQLQIARDLDARESEIADLNRNLPASDRYRRVPLGPSFVREPLHVPNARDGWQESVYGWDALHRDYLKIKDSAMSGDWLELNHRVRSILVDDQNRVLRGVNVFLDKDSGEALMRLRRAIFACVEDRQCVVPRLSPPALRLVRANSYFNYFWKKLKGGAIEPGTSRDLVLRFLKRVDVDLKRYSFSGNKTVKRAGGTIFVPLDPGPFGTPEARAQLAAYIEEIWSGSSFRVRVKWADFSSNGELFRILLGDEVGATSYVQWNDRTIQLFPGVDTRSIAHEIGHVLGFKDHYYSVWNSDACVYVYQEDETDLMSNVESGLVTSDEWKMLRRAY